MTTHVYLCAASGKMLRFERIKVLLYSDYTLLCLDNYGIFILITDSGRHLPP